MTVDLLAEIHGFLYDDVSTEKTINDEQEQADAAKWKRRILFFLLDVFYKRNSIAGVRTWSPIVRSSRSGVVHNPPERMMLTVDRMHNLSAALVSRSVLRDLFHWR